MNREIKLDGFSGHDLTAQATERTLVFEKLGRGKLKPQELAGWLRRFAKIFEKR